MISSTYLQIAGLEKIVPFFTASPSYLLEFFNVSLGILIYLVAYLPLSIIVKFYYDVLLESVIITPVPLNNRIFNINRPDSVNTPAESQANLLFESKEIAINYMEPIGLIIVIIGVGLVLFFRIFDIALDTSFDSEDAIRKLLISPVLIVLWIPIANIVLNLAAGLTDIFMGISISAEIGSSGTSSADFKTIVDSFDPGSGAQAFTESEIVPLILGSLFIAFSGLAFFLSITAAYIRLFVLYLLYAIGPLSIAMWAFSWNEISKLGKSYIKYFILLAIFPAPAALISKIAPVFIVSLETIIVQSIEGGSVSSASETAAESEGGAGDLSSTVGIDKVVRSFGLILIPLAVGFGPWVFVIGLGNAMTLAGGAALGGAALTGGGAFLASKGISGAKGSVKNAASSAVSSARQKGAVQAASDYGVSGAAKSVGSGITSAGGKIRDFGGVGYDRKGDIAESVAQSRMIGATGGFGRAIQGGASMASSASKGVDGARSTREDAEEKRRRRDTVLENYSASERFGGDGIRDRALAGDASTVSERLEGDGIRDRISGDRDNTLLSTYSDLKGTPDGALQQDDGRIGGDGYSSERANELEQRYAENNFSDEQLKRQLARENNGLEDNWKNIDDDELDNNRREAFKGFTEHIKNRSEERGVDEREFIRDEYGESALNSFDDSVRPEFRELKRFVDGSNRFDSSEFNNGGELAEVTDKYRQDGYGKIAERASREGLTSGDFDVEEARQRKKNIEDNVNKNVDGKVDDDTIEEIIGLYGSGDLSYSNETDDKLEEAIKESDIKIDSDVSEDKLASEINKLTKMYDPEDISNIQNVIDGKTGEINAASKGEHNRQVLESYANGVELDDSQSDELTNMIENVVGKITNENLSKSLAAVDASDIDTENASEIFDIEEYVGDLIDKVDGVDATDVDTRKLEESMEGTMVSIADEVVPDTSREAKKMIEETTGDIDTGEFEASLSKKTKEAISDELSYDEMGIETRQEVFDIGMSEKLAEELREMNLEEASDEIKSVVEDITDEAIEDISEDNIDTSSVAEAIDKGEITKDDIRNAIGD